MLLIVFTCQTSKFLTLNCVHLIESEEGCQHQEPTSCSAPSAFGSDSSPKAISSQRPDILWIDAVCSYAAFAGDKSFEVPSHYEELQKRPAKFK